MHEINPVLAGTFDAPNYAPPAINSGSGTNSTDGTDQVSGVDDRRYTKFDHSDTDAGTATMSFSDLVDMINPLEHIPVVSSVYRAITGDEINPVSRVVGDIIYGGALGAASAVFSGVSAIADAGLEQETGKDSGGLAVAFLFGPDDDNTVQLADAGTKTDAAVTTASTTTSTPPAPTTAAPYTTQTIELAQSATATPLLSALSVPTSPPPPPRGADTSAPDVVAPNGQAAATETTDAAADQTTTTPSANPPAQNTLSAVPQNPPSTPGVSLASTSTVADQSPVGGIPFLNSKSSSKGKQAFGGVISPPNLQAQQMAATLALGQQGQPSMRIGGRIYTNGMLNGSHSGALSANTPAAKPAAVVAPVPVLPASFTPPTAANPTTSSISIGNVSPQAAISALTSPNQSPLSTALMQEMMTKALSQYGTVASGPSRGTGSAVNYLN